MALEVKKQEESKEVSAQQSFLETLEDVIAVAQALAPFCNDSIASMVEVSKLALSNEHQSQFLMGLVLNRAAGRK